MLVEEIKKKIDKLQQQIKAMQGNDALKDDYAGKVLELIKLRRSLINKGKKALKG